MKCHLMKEIICADAMYQSTAHARGNCAQRFVHLSGGFEPPTYAETLDTFQNLGDTKCGDHTKEFTFMSLQFNNFIQHN